MHEFQFFDRKQEVSVKTKQLPHWAQAGTLTFLTWRTADSLPRMLHDEITWQRAELLRNMGLRPQGDWKAAVEKLPAAERGRVHWAMFQIWDECLGRGAGACVLRRPELSVIVKESLRHFDEDRYFLTDFVIMPNQVHLLVAFPDEKALLAQCESWKRYTAREINKRLEREGEFWQIDQFDHLVRSEEQFEHYRRYIEANGRKAGLKEGEFRWFSKDLSLRKGGS